MATRTWIAGRIGYWNVAANWTSGQVPGSGDTTLIGSGAPTITSGTTIAGEAIVLGGFDSATSVTLTAIDTTFEGYTPPNSKAETNTTLTVTGGTPGSVLEANFVAQGSTSFDGQIFVGAIGGGLAIDASGAGNSFTFSNDDGKAVMVVYQESTLSFTGGTIVNNGILQVEGGLDIDDDVSFGGTGGHVLLENGGNMSVGGSVGTGQEVDFIDTAGDVTLGSGSVFSGMFGFSTAADGNTIDAEGIDAASLRVVAATTQHPTLLQLLDETNFVLAQYRVQLVADAEFNPLPLSQQTLTMDDFSLSADGNGGSLITYTPDTPQVLQQSLAVPIEAAAGTMVSLASILKQSFGTASPRFHGITLLPSGSYTNQPTDVGYWSSPALTPTWYVNGVAVTVPTVVQDIADVQLKVGNQINNPAQFEAQVTDAASGRSAEYVLYNAWSIDPAIAQGVRDKGFGGLPTPAAVVASAETFAATYGLIPNTNFCNWIADNVAAGAGATMPHPDALLDPSQNVPGGFWRIAYTGTGPNPVSDWSTLVKPGDIVRMGWFKPETGLSSGHSTTVLGTVNASGQIRFYDNVDYVNHVEYIGIHNDDYWLHSDPADITIYRLDPNSQYLILGSSLGEVIQGSVYNDLIQPGGGADTITTGPGRDEIQGTTAELDGIAVTDFAVGDSLDFTDLASSAASVSFSGGQLHVMSNGEEVAALTVAAPKAGQAYRLSSDSNGGSTVQLLGSVTIHGSFPSGYAISPDILTLTIAADATVGGPGVSATTTHITKVVNLGTVAALGTGITLKAGGSIVNGSKTNTTASITGQDGIVFTGPGTITNYGTIEGGRGIVLSGPGTIINYGTLGNIGTIGSGSATQYLVTLNDSGARLVLEGSSELLAIDGSPGKVRGGGGVLELGALAGPGTLDGLGSAIRGFATVTIDRNAAWNFGEEASLLTGSAVLDNHGQLVLLDKLSGTGTIDNAIGAAVSLRGDFGISVSGPIDNQGLLEKTVGSGMSVVFTSGGPFTSDGTIAVRTGTLKLTGSTIDITGAITGNGTMLLAAGDTTLGAGTSLTVGGLAIQGSDAHVAIASRLGYAGDFSASANAELSIAASERLLLSGAASFDRASIDGAGQLETDGTTTARLTSLGGSLSWINVGALTATADLAIGATARFVNRSGGSVRLAGAVDLDGAPGAEIVNQGLISKSGSGTGAIAGAIRNNGNLQAASGTLDLQGAVTGIGNLLINGGVLEADAVVGAGQTVQFVGSGARLVLNDADSFAGKLASFGSGDRLDLRQFDPTTTTIAFQENSTGTQGRLSVTDATQHATFTLLGQYIAAGFHTRADGLGGTFISYKEPVTSQSSLLAAATH